MTQYEELLGRVIGLEAKLEVLKTQEANGVDGLLDRVNALETEVIELKQVLIAEVADDTRVYATHDDEMRNESVQEPVAESQIYVQSGFRVRNTGVHGHIPVQTAEPVYREPRPRKNVEFQVGKTVMSLLASLLVLCSLVLFGAMVYPYLSDGMKVIIMYAISLALVGAGLWGRRTSFKTFFTALAGCGVGAFYLSGVISYFMFNAFGIVGLFVLTYAWVMGVSWLSKSRVPVFAYICYLGILISTLLCLFEFYWSSAALICYMIGITTLYLFNRAGEYKKDLFYWVQFPVVMLLLAFSYSGHPMINMWIMILTVVAYVMQHYLYTEKTNFYRICMLLTEIVLFVGYKICDVDFGPSGFLNIIYVLLTGLVALWSYFVFGDRILKIAPICIASTLLPICSWGMFWENYIGYIPFCVIILLLGYMLQVDIMKGIATGYFVVYIFNPPSGLDELLFRLLITVYLLAFGTLFWNFTYERHIDRVAFMFVSGLVLTTFCMDSLPIMLLLGFGVAVMLSCGFNSSHFVYDDFSQRLGWAWNGYWMSFGSAQICFGDNYLLTLVLMFMMVLVLFMVNVKWQLECEHWGAGLELCIKGSFYMWMLLSQLSASGVVMSIAFLLLAIWCIVGGAMVRRKILRLYGLVLSIVSVVKCLLIDVQYSSSIYRPVGLLVAGLLCFGISWLYSVLERKLRDDSQEIDE